MRKRLKSHAAAMEGGFTFTEVLIAMLLMATAVSMVAGTLLQSSGRSQALQRKEQAALQVNWLLQDLKNYVTADYLTDPVVAALDNCWNFRNPPITGPCVGYALQGSAAPPGTLHDVTFKLPAEWRNPPYNATLRYWVRISPATNNLPEVKVSMNWTDP